jgi:hypothetical protein
VHISVEVLLRAGMLPSSTVGEPGTQGAGVTGNGFEKSCDSCGMGLPQDLVRSLYLPALQTVP